MAFFSKTIAICILEVLFLLTLKCYADENCETLPTEIHVTKGITSLFLVLEEKVTFLFLFSSLT